jgi:hypothetical protein
MSRLAIIVVICTAVVLGVGPPTAFAQSSISGVVKDSTGAVLPGVTVEAVSPALIEQARRVVTDGNGVYDLVDLRPGTYRVTFSLEGFNTVVRDGIELRAAFTASINVDLTPGALEETITVSGVSPTVDVRNVLQRSVMPRELTDNLPSTRSPQAFVRLTPGIATVRLGTMAGDRNELSMATHGGNAGEAQIRIDGDQAVMISGPGALYQAMRFNQGYVQEISVVTGGASAEQESSGLVANIIPREGGNTFSGTLYAGYSGTGLVGDNLTEELKAKGLTSVNDLVRLWDVTPAIGGPILVDRLWFFTAVRSARSVQTRAGLFEDLDPRDWVYTPDQSRPSTDTVHTPDANARLTWQAAAKHKVNFFVQRSGYRQQNRNSEQLLATEATGVTKHIPNIFAQLTWKSPATNRLYLEAGFSTYLFNREIRPQPNVDVTVVAARDVGGVFPGIGFRAATDWSYWKNYSYDYKANATYLAGTHAFKVGTTLRRGWDRFYQYENIHDYSVTVRSGIPQSLTLYATPWEREQAVNANLGVFAQDRWTIDRVSLNLGIRYDYFNGSAAETDLPPVQWVPARRFPAVSDTPNWHDVSPRIGVTYDLFGDSRTAIKVNMGRYVDIEGTGLATANHPLTRSVLSVNRTWTDRNGNFIPDCDLRDPNENVGVDLCGAISNRNFGLSNPFATTYSPEVLRGFAARGFNWTTSVELQREIVRNVSVTAGYYRRRAGNFQVTRNLLVDPSDYDPYCYTAPVDPRLPGGGGYQVCGLYDVKPEKFGQTLNRVDTAEKYGKRTDGYDGFDLTGNARFPNGANLAGGLNVGRTTVNSCFVVNSPQELLYCDTSRPYQPNFKLYGVYPMPWAGFQVSGTLQVIPGPQITASQLVTSAEIYNSLGRHLAQGSNGTVNVPLIAPGTMFAEHGQQLDLRISKRFSLGRTRLDGNVDLFNVFNGSAVQAHSVTYGVAWLRPTQIQGPRGVQLSAQLSF